MTESARQTCPECGSTRLYFELRDAGIGPGGQLPPRRSFGSWVVCARGATDADLEWLNARWLTPPELARMIAEYDRVVSV